ncbi:MAG: hypothetical protein P8X43_03710 [Maritimibacter sp.]
MKRFFQGLVVVSCLALTGPAYAERQLLTRDQALVAAITALNERKPQVSLALSNLVLSQNPKDVQAHILRSRALRVLGQTDAARQAAQQANSLADTRQERFGAEMALGQAQASGGHFISSKFWLRQAYGDASTEQEQQIAANIYRMVRANSPISFQGSFGFTPNSNVNNGSSADVIWLGGLPFTPLIYSGYTASASAALSYRFSGDQGNASYLGLKASGFVHFLDADSRTLIETNANPDDTVHDFDFVSLEGTFRQHYNMGNSRGLDLTASLGHSWYGWQSYANFATLGAEYTMPLGSRGNSLALFANTRGEVYTDATRDPIYAIEAGPRVSFKLADGSKASLSFSGQGALSPDENSQFFGGRIKASYELGHPVMGVGLSVSGELSYRDYPVSPYDVNGRQDFHLGGKVNATLSNFNFMGFSPVLTAEIAHTYSSFAAYERDTKSIGLEFQSRF